MTNAMALNLVLVPLCGLLALYCGELCARWCIHNKPLCFIKGILTTCLHELAGICALSDTKTRHSALFSAAQPMSPVRVVELRNLTFSLIGML